MAVNGEQVNGVNGAPAYNPHALVGSLLDEEEEPVPLFYFTSVGEIADYRSTSPV